MGLIISPENNLYLKEIFEEGKLKAKEEDAKKLYKKLKLQPQQIAEILEIPVEVVKKAIGEE